MRTGRPRWPAEIGDVRADLRLLQWMGGFNTALVVAVLTLLLRDLPA